MYDLIIIGSGPAGLAAAVTARDYGLDCLVIEKASLANTIFEFPIARRLFSTANELVLEPGAMPPQFKPTREELLLHYTEVVARKRINVHTGEEVLKITPDGETFRVTTSRDEYASRTVLAAVGGFGRFRRLGVPGDHPSRVSYRFVDPSPYAGKPVLVIGGGNSAAEASLFLSEVGAGVTLAIRRESLNTPARIKPWVLEPLKKACAEGHIRILASSEIVEIQSSSALLRIKPGLNDSFLEEIECDHVFALIGRDPDTGLLEDAGVEIAADGRPLYDPLTYETCVPGLYVAGHLTRERHIKNALEIARRVVAGVATRMCQESIA